MKSYTRHSLTALVATLVATALIVGCEVTSKSDDVKVEPGSASIRKGEAIGLHASGGEDYVWTLSDRTLGTLSDTHGENVVYTSLVAPSTPVVQTITVVADAARFGTGTNSQISAELGRAYITHVNGSAPTSTVTVTPVASSVTFGNTVLLRATGDKQYTWTLENPSWGILSQSSGGSTVYTSQYAPPVEHDVVQKITVTGSMGGIGYAYVTHSGFLLNIYPPMASLRYGETQTFNVTGGSIYSWTLSQPSWGALSYDGSFHYKSFYSNSTTTVATQIITISDVSGVKNTATVYHIPQ